MSQNLLRPVPAQQILKSAAPQPSDPSIKQWSAPLQPMRAPGYMLFCGQPGHFARDFAARNQARKPPTPAVHEDQVNYCEDTVASECTGPNFL